MREGGQASSKGGALQVGEYEFTLFVTTAAIKMKFPCKFSLCWKIGTINAKTAKYSPSSFNLEGYEKVEQSGGSLTFNEQLRLRTRVVSSDSGRTHQPRKVHN